YSVRLRRWTRDSLPGCGRAIASRSISRSRKAATESDVVRSGRGEPAGGMAPVLSLRTTFSQVSAFAAGCATSTDASVRPPVFRRSLWQVTQYLLMVAAGDATAGAAAAGACAPIAPIADD